ncbi:MAG: hypothetical protein A4E55_01742 [Pelotomaculum sp. PtaU1.Bin035]|nr:MAG: hypothetical protein A4E55_01742 [Pelotomaculum sp. PtaU1.Bin035]
MKNRCMLCGKPIEEEILNTDPFDDDDDMFQKKPAAICIMCQAKLKNEADNTQKYPKPM